MKKIHYLALALITICLNSCFAIVGSAVRLGYDLGILVFKLRMYSAFIILGLILWVLIKRTRKGKQTRY